jgi:Na+/H+ antiporter NhaD/arsenite permease-like protein
MGRPELAYTLTLAIFAASYVGLGLGRLPGLRVDRTGVAAAAALVSNLVSNVPAVLLFKPLIPTLGEPDRAWLILAMATTLAGNLTLLGSANLIVAEAARAARIEIGFLEYCRVGVPLTIVTLAIGWLVLVLIPV